MLVKEALEKIVQDIAKAEIEIANRIKYINEQAGYDLIDPSWPLRGITGRIASLLNQDRILNKEIK